MIGSKPKVCIGWNWKTKEKNKIPQSVSKSNNIMIFTQQNNCLVFNIQQNKHFQYPVKNRKYVKNHLKQNEICQEKKGRAYFEISHIMK